MLRIAVAVIAALALAPAAARADSIVFVRGGDIWSVAPDGSGAHRIAQGTFAWPSQADDGALAAVDAAGAIHRLTSQGAEIGAPLPTAATTQTADDNADPPTHVRVSPDGTLIAYDEAIDDEVTTLWTPFSATGLDFPGQAAGQELLEDPSWIGSDELVLTRDVSALGLGASTVARYSPGDGDDSAADWFSDARDDWASDYEAAVARTGDRVAVLADDAAANDGVPTRAQLRVYDVAGDAATPACDIDLPAAETVDETSPSFSPDGTRLAWAEADGIHVVTPCAGSQKVIAGPGAWEPYWSAAGATAGGGTGPGSAAGGAGGSTTLTLRVSVKRHPLRARIACSQACALRVRFGRATVKRALAKAGSVTVRLHAKRGTRVRLRVSAPGAKTVSREIRA